jgi:hypothetical protein
MQERMKKAVAALGGPEVDRILEDEDKIEVTCHFCSETFAFGEEEVRRFLDQGAEELARREAAAREAGCLCETDTLPEGEARDWREQKIREVSKKCGGDVLDYYYSEDGQGRKELEDAYWRDLERRIREKDDEVTVLDKEMAELDEAIPDDFVEKFEDYEAEAARGAGLKMEDLTEEERVLVQEFDDRIGLTYGEEVELAAKLEEAKERLQRKGAEGGSMFWPSEPMLDDETEAALREEAKRDKEDFVAAMAEGRSPRRKLPYPVVGVLGKREKDLKVDPRLEPPAPGVVDDPTQPVSADYFEGIDWKAAQVSYGRAGPPKLIKGGFIDGATEDSWWNGGTPADVLNTMAQEALVEVADSVAEKVQQLSPAERRALKVKLEEEKKNILEGSGGDEIQKFVEEAQQVPMGQHGEAEALALLSAEFAKLERELPGDSGSDEEAERQAEIAARGGMEEVQRQVIDIMREIQKEDAKATTAAGKVGPDDLQSLFWNPKAGNTNESAAE